MDEAQKTKNATGLKVALCQLAILYRNKHTKFFDFVKENLNGEVRVYDQEDRFSDYTSRSGQARDESLFATRGGESGNVSTGLF